MNQNFIGMFIVAAGSIKKFHFSFTMIRFYPVVPFSVEARVFLKSWAVFE